MKLQRWKIIVFVVVASFCSEIKGSTCPTPDVFEYRFDQLNCPEHVVNFPSTIAEAGGMTMPRDGMSRCSSVQKKVKRVEQSYESGIFGVRSGNFFLHKDFVGLRSSKTISDSGIKSKFNDGFTLEFVVRPTFHYAELLGPTNYFLAQIGYNSRVDRTCETNNFGVSLYVRVLLDGSVQFMGELKGPSCESFDIPFNATTGETSVFEMGVISHITFSVSPKDVDGGTTDIQVTVAKLGGKVATDKSSFNKRFTTVEWKDDFRLYLSSARETISAFMEPWTSDLLYASGYTDNHNSSCRTDLINAFMKPVNQLPVAGEVVFTTDEDTTLPGSIGDFGYDHEGDLFNIEFTQLPPVSQGVIKVDHIPVQLYTKILSTKDYTFEPAENFNGDVTFKIRASTSDGVMLLSAPRTATIEVKPVNDKPTLILSSKPYFVRPGLDVLVEVKATDVEGPYGTRLKLTAGDLNHQGKLAATSAQHCVGVPFSRANQVVTHTIEEDGRFKICYVPNPSISTMSNAEILFQDTVDVSIRDAADYDIWVFGAIKVNVMSPLQGCGQDVSNALECVGKSKHGFHEDQQDPMDTGFLLHGSDTLGRAINFRITKLPVHGKLYLDDNNVKGAEITTVDTIIAGPEEGAIHDVSIKLYYEPNNNYYNTRLTIDGRSHKDLFGGYIGTCDDRDTFDGYCPDTLGFRVETKNSIYKSPESIFPLYVANVVDEYLVVDEPRMADVTIRPRSVGGKTVDEFARFTIVGDKFIDTVDGDCFLYSITVEQTKAKGTLMLSTVKFLPDSLEVIDGIDCLENGCSKDISVIGPPSALNLFVESLKVSIPENRNSIGVKFVVRQGSNLNSDPVYEETVTVSKDLVLLYGVIFGSIGVLAVFGSAFIIVKRCRGSHTKHSKPLELFAEGGKLEYGGSN